MKSNNQCYVKIHELFHSESEDDTSDEPNFIFNKTQLGSSTYESDDDDDNKRLVEH